MVGIVKVDDWQLLSRITHNQSGYFVLVSVDSFGKSLLCDGCARRTRHRTYGNADDGGALS